MTCSHEPVERFDQILAVWTQAVERVARAEPRPSDLRVMLALSCHLDSSGTFDLDNGEWTLTNATGLAGSTVFQSVRYLVALGVLERVPGDGRRRHRVKLSASPPSPAAPMPPHEVW